MRRTGWTAWTLTASAGLTLSLLVVPVVGGVTQLVELRGDTPFQETSQDATQDATQDTTTGPTPQAEYLGTVDITASDVTHSGIYAHVPVGGISGIDCAVGADPDTDSRCIAISDDPGRRGPVRAYDLDPETGEVGEPIVLTDGRGVPYRPGVVDPESIRFTGSNASASTETSRDAGLVWTAEGTPTVTVADRHGRATGTLPVAEGIRRNQGLEGLAVTGAGTDTVTDTADDQRIITATEAAPDGHDHPVITVYEGEREVASYNWPGTGISEILADPTDATGLLVLERGYTGGRGNSAMIWRTTLPGTGGAGTGVLKRELVADLGALIGHSDVGNTEAMAWAPGRHPGTTDELPELLIATDDNFSDGQRGVLHRVRVR